MAAMPMNCSSCRRWAQIYTISINNKNTIHDYNTQPAGELRLIFEEPVLKACNTFTVILAPGIGSGCVSCCFGTGCTSNDTGSFLTVVVLGFFAWFCCSRCSLASASMRLVSDRGILGLIQLSNPSQPGSSSTLPGLFLMNSWRV